MQDYNWLKWLTSIFHEQAWMIAIFTVVFITAVIHSIETFFYKRIAAKLDNSKTVWNRSFVEAIHRPLVLLIWVMGISIAVDIAGAFSAATYIMSLTSKVRSLTLLLTGAWFAIRFIKISEKNFLEQGDDAPVDKTTLNALSQLLRLTVIISSTLIAMQMFQLDITALVTFGGIGTAAIAFAAKDLLGNFFGGLMIYLDRPFNVGDWVRSPDKNIEGTVEEIGWRLTRIRTFDKRPLYVPNGTFSTISVENPSRMLNRRIKTLVGLRYDDAQKVEVIIQDVEKMLREHPEIDTKQTMFVNLVEFGPSSLNFMVYTFTKTTNWVKFQGIQQDVFLKIIDIITQHDAECAFPTSTLHMPGLEHQFQPSFEMSADKKDLEYN